MNTLADVRVLLLEDDPAFARIVQILLAGGPDAAFEIEIAYSISEARELFEATRSPCDKPRNPDTPRPFDAIVTDLGLPPHNGEKTVCLVREMVGLTPIVVLTGVADARVIAGIVGAGADDFVAKDEILGQGGLIRLERALRGAIKTARLREEAAREKDYSRSLELQIQMLQQALVGVSP